MLTRLHLQNFTVFADANFEFSPGLNVLVGTNGTGKSHVLKVGYAAANAVAHQMRLINNIKPKGRASTKSYTLFDARDFEKKLEQIFLSKQGRYLVRYGVEESALISVGFGAESSIKAKYSVRPDDDEFVVNGNLNYVSGALSACVFVPPKEVLSFYYGFISLYEKREVDYDLTYPELCRELSTPLLRKVDDTVAEALTQLQTAMGGTVKIEGNRFVFVPTGSTDSLPINLYAEGLRKFGTLWQLLRNGSLTPETTLFWDEPEANLNPALLKKLAAVLAALARQGFQIILATHSLFLLKELHILSRDKKEKELPLKYFGLNADPNVPGSPTQVTAVDDFEMLPDIVALDVELQQSDELTRVFAEDDAFQAPATDANAD